MKKILTAMLCAALFAGCACAAPKAATLTLLCAGATDEAGAERFIGWTDAKMTRDGVKQCFDAGLTMKENGYEFDVIHTSLLDRSIATAWLVSSAMRRAWVPVEGYWRLNERSYGALEGLSVAEVTASVGTEAVESLTSSVSAPAPALSEDDERAPENDPRYASVDRRLLPLAESLQDTYDRVGAYWNDVLLPQLNAGKNVLVVAHSESLRALSAWIDASLDEEALLSLRIANAQPIVYALEIDNGLITVVSREEIAVADHAIPMPKE